MPTMNLDFSNVPSREPLPEGVYHARIAKAEQVLSKTSNNPMLKVEFDIEHEEFQGRKVWGNYVLTVKAMWKVQELFKALGLDTEGIVSLETEELVGLECDLKITQREYQGDIQNEIAKAM